MRRHLNRLVNVHFLLLAHVHVNEVVWLGLLVSFFLLLRLTLHSFGDTEEGSDPDSVYIPSSACTV